MDDRMLAKLNILLKKNPGLGEFLRKQTEAISDEELERITGGDKCEFSSPCWEDSACQWDANLGALFDHSKLCTDHSQAK